MATLFVLDQIVHSTFSLSQITSKRIACGIDTETGYAAGHVDPMFRGTRQQRAMIDGSTPQLKTVLSASLANCGLRGVSAATPLTSYLKKKTTTGNVARATAEHRKFALNSWHMFWSKITLPHRGVGEAQLTINAVYDGTNDPIVYTPDVALVGNLTTPEYFGCGPVEINGTALSALIENIEIDSGVKIIQLGGQDNPWDSIIATEQTDPIVTVKCAEEVNWSLLGLDGIELDGVNGLEFYGRRKGPLGPVANGTASHIYFQGTHGRAIPVDTNGQASGPVSDTLRVELIAPDDSTLPLLGTVDTTIV